MDEDTGVFSLILFFCSTGPCMTHTRHNIHRTTYQISYTPWNLITLSIMEGSIGVICSMKTFETFWFIRFPKLMYNLNMCRSKLKHTKSILQQSPMSLMDHQSFNTFQSDNWYYENLKSPSDLFMTSLTCIYNAISATR